MIVEVPVSVGELIDKITILEIKLSHVKDILQKDNIKKELDLLNKKLSKLDYPTFYYESLKAVNNRLWEIEDLIRKKEILQDFGEDFILYARMIYMYNDTRAEIKREINRITDSDIVEEKIY